MTQPPSGEWVYFDTELTNSSGRVSYVIPAKKRLGIGVYPVKMVVRCVNSQLPGAVEKSISEAFEFINLFNQVKSGYN